MVEGFSSEARSLDGYREVLLEFGLAGEVREPLRTQSGFELPLVIARGCRNNAFLSHHVSCIKASV
jgi:hypothetical protein